MWYVYIILCENNSLYTGIAKDPHKRFQTHTKGKGAKYTKIYKPVRLVYIEEVGEHSDALKRERAIKALPRSKKLQLQNL